MKALARSAAQVVAVVVLFLTIQWWLRPQTVVAAPQGEAGTRNLDATQTLGRFQIFHVYYSTAQQGTGMIDSETGRVWLLAHDSKSGSDDLYEVLRYLNPNGPPAVRQ